MRVNECNHIKENTPVKLKAGDIVGYYSGNYALIVEGSTVSAPLHVVWLVTKGCRDNKPFTGGPVTSSVEYDIATGLAKLVPCVELVSE